MPLTRSPGQLPPGTEVVRELRRSGRVRLRVPGMGRDRRLGRELVALARSWPGVRTVGVDARSERVLVVTDGTPLPIGVAPASRARASRPSRPRFWRGAEAAPTAEWHALGVGATLARLGSGAHGLTSAEADARRKRFGDNALEEARPRSRLALFASQVANVPSALLGAASVVSTALGEWIDAGAIVTVLGLNAAIGYTVERNSEKLLASWRRAEAGDVSVMRDGRARQVRTGELVPGDVVLLRGGDVVPADARVLEAHRLQVDEAPLTGESEPVPKQPAPVAAEAPLADRVDLVFAGTTVVGGRGRAVVVAIGGATELARVRRLIDETAAPETPLARRLDRLSHRVAAGAMAGAAVVGAAGLVHGRPLRQILRGAVALGLAALPEGLPVVSTAALVRSMARMRADGMVVRRLSSAETLGGVTVICTDKTGTLTLNDMQLELCDLDGAELAPSLLRAHPARMFSDRVTTLLGAALLNSDVDVHRRGHEILSISGSSTERALVMAAHAAGLAGDELRTRYPTLRLKERDHGVHYVVSLHDGPEGRVAFVKGAPEQVLALCDRRFDAPMSDADRVFLRARNEALARRGLRVLGVAWRRVEGRGLPERGYRWLGMVALRDPLRPGAADAIADAARAGIRTVIVTGDQRSTAQAIARQLGLAGEAVDGAEATRLAHANTPAGRARLARVSVVSRVSPADKLAIVEALRGMGEVVAMAGDGINDAPALKSADVGVAVGRNASDLARHVADVVLASEDLRSILAAVAEGRIVQDNLRRALRFLFATNLSELALMLGAAFVGAADPLTPLQLLWINLLTDTLPALALALEPGDRTVLNRPPAPPDGPLFSRAQTLRIGRDGGLMAVAGGLGALVGGPPLAFGALMGAQLAYTVECRAAGTPATPRFVGLVGGTAALQVAALTFGPLRRLLSLPSAGLPLFGFGAAFALPFFVGRLRGGDEVVRDGRALRRAPDCAAPLLTPEPTGRIA